jgi:hypothetical protein
MRELEPADVLAVEREHVEGHELKRPTPAHEIDEDRSSALVELHDLAVEHRVVSVQVE